jgi:hypothetical protein
MKKKFLAVVLTGAMVIGSSVVAFADTTNDGTAATSITANSELNTPTISVTITDPGTAIVANPYKLVLEDKDDSTDSLGGTTYTLSNGSDCEVSVSFTGTLAVEGSVTLASSKDAVAKATKPTVYVQAVVKDANATTGGYAVYDTKSKATTVDGKTAAEATAVVYTKTGAAYTPSIVMERKDATKTDAAIDIDLSGESAGAGWGDTDKFTVTTVISVAPSTSEANVKCAEKASTTD